MIKTILLRMIITLLLSNNKTNDNDIHNNYI